MLKAGNVISSCTPSIVTAQGGTRLNVSGIGPSPRRESRDVVLPAPAFELVKETVPAHKVLLRGEDCAGRIVDVPESTVIRRLPVSAPIPHALPPIAPTAFLGASYDEDFPYGNTSFADVTRRQKVNAGKSSSRKVSVKSPRFVIPSQGTVHSKF